MPQQDPLSIEQRGIVNKRLSLNLLIQGAATHAYATAHYLVADGLNVLDEELFPIYEQMMLRARLGYWAGGIPMIMGSPTKFWKRISRNEHEFGFHPFFVKHGFELAIETKADVKRRCRAANISTNGVRNEIASAKLYLRLVELETPHLEPLQQLAKDACHEIYQIDKELLFGEITQSPSFGVVREPKTTRGKLILQCMAGWSAVVRQKGRLTVKAKAAFWPLLLHELVKGSVELICLHGMSALEDDDFEVVMNHTEHVEFEIPMLQVGGTFFQKFLAARPREISLAECIMHVAKLEPEILETLMFQLIESPNRATDMIRVAAKGN